MGRRPKPAGLKTAQGNPGHRHVPEIPAQPAPAPIMSDGAIRLNTEASALFEYVSSALKRMNFVRQSDDPLLRRYCDLTARFWRLSQKVDALGGETYECETTVGGKMERIRPHFLAMMMLSKRLETMEDRLGLSPAARQQYLLKVFAAGQQPTLPGAEPELPTLDDAGVAPPVPDLLSGGVLRRDALN